MSKSKRERKDDFQNVYSAMKSVNEDLIREQLTHDQWLGHRDLRVFQHEAWPRLTAAHQAEVFGMGRGVIDSLHVLAVVWCHFYKGKFQTSKECHLDLDFEYSKIDTDKSRHCWRDSRKPFSGR